MRRNVTMKGSFLGVAPPRFYWLCVWVCERERDGGGIVHMCFVLSFPQPRSFGLTWQDPVTFHIVCLNCKWFQDITWTQSNPDCTNSHVEIRKKSHHQLLGFCLSCVFILKWAGKLDCLIRTFSVWLLLSTSCSTSWYSEVCPASKKYWKKSGCHVNTSKLVKIFWIIYF